MEQVRIGVIGAGYMGRSYARLIKQHPQATLAGIVDLSAAAGRALAESAGTTYYDSSEDLLAASRPHALVVATVEDAHRAPAVAALTANIGVLVEKPIATTVEDAAAIIAAARRGGAPLMVGHVLRFDARYAQIRELVAAGQIGEPLTIFARRLNGKRAQDRLRGRCSLPVFLGVHDFDIVRWIIGHEIRHVFAQSHTGFLAHQGYPVEDATWALLTFANGTLGAVEEGWVLPNGHPSGFDQQLDVTGSTGRATLTAAYQGLAVTSDERETWPDTQLWPAVNGQISGALERQLNHFVDCVRHGQTPLVSGEDGLAALHVALAVEESARTNRRIDLGESIG